MIIIPGAGVQRGPITITRTGTVTSIANLLRHPEDRPGQGLRPHRPDHPDHQALLPGLLEEEAEDAEGRPVEAPGKSSLLAQIEKLDFSEFVGMTFSLEGNVS